MDQDAINLAKAIRQKESQGDFNAVGDAGTSHGAYQFQPNTWKAYSKEILGNENAPMTRENQNAVAYGKIKKWKDSGKNPAQIAAMWNAGEGIGDNWTSHKGKTVINGKVISYDTPAYVKAVIDNYQQLKGQGSGYVVPPALGKLGNDQVTQNFPTSEHRPTLGEDLVKRTNDIGGAISDTISGKINPVSGLIQTFGGGAGMVNDLVTHGLENIPIVGKGVQKAEELIGKGVGAAAKTGVGQKVVQKIGEFSQEHPELSKDISSVGNIAGALGLVTGAGAAKNAIGEGIGRALGKDVLQDVITDVAPQLGKKRVVTDIAKRGTTKSLLKGEISTVMDPETRKIAEAVVENVPKFKKLSTFSEKVNAVQDGISNLSNELRTGLTSREVQPLLTPDDVLALENEMKNEILRHPLLVGNSGEQAKRIFDVFKSYLPEGDITMEDVLNARQKLDRYVEKIKPKAFDPATENAFSTALRSVRQGANNLMERKVPDVGVKELLRKQTLLFDAIENMAPKAFEEIGTTSLGRLAAKHPLITGAAKKTLRYAGMGIGGGLGYKAYEGLTK